MAHKNPSGRNSEANGDHNFSRTGQEQSWPIHTANTVKLLMTTISRQNLVFESFRISIRDNAALERSESNFKAIQREFGSGYILWRDENRNENLWRFNVGRLSGQSHCCESINIPVCRRGIFRTTASGFAIIHTLLIGVFRCEDIKNVRRSYNMQLGRMRKAHDRKENVNEYDEYGYWFHGDLTLILLIIFPNIFDIG